MVVRFAKPIIVKPLGQDVLSRIKHRAMIFKLLVAKEHEEQHVILLFEDLSAAYHIRTMGELDRIIDGLQNIREQARGTFLQELG